MKSLLEHTTDPCMALMTYRAIPLPWCKLSPVELLIGHKLCTDIYPRQESIWYQTGHISKGSERWTKSTRKQNYQFDQQRRVQELPPLPENASVWISTQGQQCSKIICCSTLSSQLRRNHWNLKVRPENTDISLAYNSLECTSNTIITCSCSVTIFQPPDRLIYYYS